MRFFRDLEGSLGRGRIFTYCGILLAVEIGVFAMFIAGTHGLIVPLSGATSTDFVSFYAAGTLADAGEHRCDPSCSAPSTTRRTACRCPRL